MLACRQTHPQRCPPPQRRPRFPVPQRHLRSPQRLPRPAQLGKPATNGMAAEQPPRHQLASDSGGLPSAVNWAHLLIRDRLQPGDHAVDATAGNGHDSLFLAKLLGQNGHVWAFDVQLAAVEETRRRLTENGITSATVLHAGHEQMTLHIPETLHGQLGLVLFNLGYLPGSDKSVITHTETTLEALRQAIQLIRPGGLVITVIYPGHAGGADELRAISAWCTELCPRTYEVQCLRPVNRAAAPPECWAILKRSKK
jgi:precorrin-6B methylase 2